MNKVQKREKAKPVYSSFEVKPGDKETFQALRTRIQRSEEMKKNKLEISSFSISSQPGYLLVVEKF